MFKIIGKICIFIFGIFLIVLGISEFIFFFVQYIHIFDTVHIILSILQGLTCLSIGISSVILITKNGKTSFLAIPTGILLGLGIYYFIAMNQFPTHSYYLALGIMNLVCSLILFSSFFFNRKN